MPNQTNQIQTIEITNFSGRLTRIPDGNMNSGLAKYSTSWGYDPFISPGNLTWLEAPVDCDPNNSSILGIITSSKSKTGDGNNGESTGTGYLYAVDHLANVYRLTPNNSFNQVPLSGVSIISQASSSTLSGYTYGGGVEIFGSSEQLYLGGDGGVERINFDGSSRSSVAGGSSVVTNIPRPLTQFSGNLVFGNGTNIGLISSSSIVSSYNQLNPSLPPQVYVHDIEISADLNYLISVASDIVTDQATTKLGGRALSNSGDTLLVQWNGSDLGFTAGFKFPTFFGSAVHSFLDRQLSIGMDSYGASIIDGTNKKVTLQGVRPPFPNAVGSNGNILHLVSVEKFNNSLQASLFYYGQFDEESQAPGLWRLFSLGSTQTNGWIDQVPWQVAYCGQQYTTNNASSVLATLGGKHIFSLLDVSNGGGTSKFKTYAFALPASGNGTPQLGVYETQTQIFSKKGTIKQVRVYCQPTATGNGFQLDMIGSDGNVISNGWAGNTYTFTAGSDPTLLQGSLERIDFNPVMKNTFAVALRITNTGTTNMTIEKIEVDWAPAGK